MNGILFTNRLTMEERYQLFDIITNTEERRKKIEKTADNIDLIVFFFCLLAMGVSYISYVYMNWLVSSFVFLAAAFAISGSLFCTIDGSKFIASKILHINGKLQATDESLCIKYRTQLEIEEYLDELNIKKFNELQSSFKVGFAVRPEMYIPVEFYRKYATKDTGNVSSRIYKWSLCSVEENTKVKTATLDIRKLELKIPIDKEK